ncbi:unnamed protein product [Arctia plantaginis]|uniref:MADF domain-containing protein n=1 Tax=Arctia plantaginis TaxID=874455 RepID=A0A8S0ZJ11_ARCPL|nr:unnamed protein product [Arctia plantaginis]
MQIVQKRILEDVKPLRIIREVEKWPAIYEKDSPEMSNHHFRHKVWEEVAKNVFENYQIYTAEEKKSKVTDLMKKWRNLRDTFKRHLKQQKNNRAQEGPKDRKKEYVYFKHMSFLLPHMDGGGGTRESRAGRHSPLRRSRLTTLDRSRRDRSVDALSPSASSCAIEHIDADKHFLLSLLPSFKSMSENEKLTAKMEILKVIKDVKTTSAALETVVANTTPWLAPAVAHSDEETNKVKNELFTVEELDYESPIDSGGGDTE